MKIKNLFILPLLAGLMLVGCKNNKSEVKPSEPEIVEPDTPSEPETDPVLLSIAISGEFKTKYYVGEEFDATGIVVTASYDKGEPKDVTADTVFSGFDSSTVGETAVTATYLEQTAEINLAIVAHSLAEVEADIAGALSKAVGQTTSFEDTGHGYDAIWLTLSAADAETYIDTAAQEVIAPAVNTLYNFMPDYLTVAAVHFYTVEEDFWGDGSTTYVAVLTNEDETVEIDIVGYCYNSKLVGAIWVSTGLLLGE